MGRIEAKTDLFGDARRINKTQTSMRREVVLQVDAVEQLKRQKWGTRRAVHTRVEDIDDMRTLRARGGAGLAKKALHHLAVARQMLMQAKAMSAPADEMLPVEPGKGTVTVNVNGTVQMTK